MKVVPPKDLGSNVNPSIIHWHIHVFAYDVFNHSTSTLEHTLIFLKCMVSEHLFMDLVSFSSNL